MSFRACVKRRLGLRLGAVAAAVLALAGCGGDGDDVGAQPLDGAAMEGEVTGSSRSSEDGGSSGPLVLEAGSQDRDRGGDANFFLAADAAPVTELGELRARYLPAWSSDLDWAFPPKVCDSAWEFDAIAVADPFAEQRVLGDLSKAVARSVMRYEYLLSRALSEPTVLAQLCVAVGSVDPARAENLKVLKSYLDDGRSNLESGSYPDKVVVVAHGSASALAVACVEPGYATVRDSEGEIVEAPDAPVRMQAYLLLISRGSEDRVRDVSYRVSSTVGEPADDCSDIDLYADEWAARALEWADEGRLWAPARIVVDVSRLCRSSETVPKPDCPADWPV